MARGRDSFAIQFIVIAVFSAHEYDAIDLSIDFGNSYQAVWLICLAI